MAARNADDKKGFCLFFDWVKDLDFLSGAEAWTVVKALCDYYENGVNPVDNVPNELKSIVSMMFHQIQRQEDIKAKRAEAGRNGGFATAKNSKASSKVQQKSPTETNTNTETDTNTYIESENAPTPNKKAASTTKQDFDKAKFNAYAYERIGEYRTYEKAVNVVNDEFLLSHWYIEQINAIVEVAKEYENTGGTSNTFMALFGAIETIIKNANDTLIKGEQRIISIIPPEEKQLE